MIFHRASRTRVVRLRTAQPFQLSHAYATFKPLTRNAHAPVSVLHLIRCISRVRTWDLEWRINKNSNGARALVCVYFQFVLEHLIRYYIIYKFLLFHLERVIGVCLVTTGTFRVEARKLCIRLNRSFGLINGARVGVDLSFCSFVRMRK